MQCLVFVTVMYLKCISGVAVNIIHLSASKRSPSCDLMYEEPDFSELV